MANIYELTNDFITVQEMMSSGEYNVEALENTLECLEFELEEKAENYAKIMKNLTAEVEGLKAEENRLSQRRKSIENNIKFLKKNLETAMILTGKRKFKTALFSFSIQPNGGKQSLDIHSDVPEEYQKIVIEPDNDKIREALESGKKLDFAVLKERGEGLRIR